MDDKTESKQKYWFKRRRYGYGWVPVTWQGFLSIALYILFIFTGAFIFLDEGIDAYEGRNALYFLEFILLTLLLIKLAYKRGPTPKWRWGKKPSDNPDEDW